jgi:5-dehydro-2-deoxygluconokinase
MLLEIIPSKVGPTNEDTSAQIIQRFYDLGVYPDWWKLEPFTTAKAWDNACAAITKNDPHVRGVVVLGLDASESDLAASLALAAKHPLVKGFAIGRTIFGDAARAWLQGQMTDDAAVQMMSDRYARLASLWDKVREGASK